VCCAAAEEIGQLKAERDQYENRLLDLCGALTAEWMGNPYSPTLAKDIVLAVLWPEKHAYPRTPGAIMAEQEDADET
jgi:hypothetical protein